MEQVFQNVVHLSNALAIATNSRILSPEQSSYILKKYLRENNLLPALPKLVDKKKVNNDK